MPLARRLPHQATFTISMQITYKTDCVYVFCDFFPCNMCKVLQTIMTSSVILVKLHAYYKTSLKWQGKTSSQSL